MVRVDAAGAGDATPLGLGIILADTQGSPALRANPGLNDGIPLGFSGISSQEFQTSFSSNNFTLKSSITKTLLNADL